MSVGRRPRSEGIGLEDAGVKVDERGFVVVDGNLRTNVDGVYAVGDVVATPQLAHVAFSEAIVAIKTMLGEEPDADRLRQGAVGHLLPSGGRVLRAHRSRRRRERGYEVETSVHRWGGNGRALIIGETDGIVKIVAERDGPILGVHIAGPWATELIAEAYLSVNWEATAGRHRAAHPRAPDAVGAVR